jgi:hypothetical protein
VHSNTGEVSVLITSDQEVCLKFTQRQDREVLDGSIRQLLPLLQSLVDARNSQIQLSSTTPLNRHRAICALEMLAGARLHETTRIFDAIPKLAGGEVVAADVGFPEFNDDDDPAWAD